MEKLTDLVRRYLSASTREERVALGQELAHSIRPPIYAFLMWNCGQPELAEDLSQDTLIVVFQRLEQWRGDSDKIFIGWCRGIARYKLCDHFRRHQETEDIASVSESELWKIVEASTKNTPLSAGERPDYEYAVSLILKARSPCNKILQMYYIEETSYEDIAAFLGISYNAARMQIKRCLREVIEDIGPP